jgi:hypothetical protein
MFNFLKNAIKKPIDIDITTSSKYYSENIEEFICQTKFPSWTKDIHMPSIKEIVNHMFEHKGGYSTIRTCPAFVDILKNSFSIFSPCDIVIEIDKETKSWRWVSRTKHINVVQHDLIGQMGSNNPFLGKGIHCKIDLPFIFKSSEPINLFFTQPMYHSISDLTVIPGLVELNKKMGMQLNLNTFISNPHIEYDTGTEKTKIIHIKKGDILAYLYYGKQVKIGDIKTSYVPFEQLPNMLEHFSLTSDWIKTNRE